MQQRLLLFALVMLANVTAKAQLSSQLSVVRTDRDVRPQRAEQSVLPLNGAAAVSGTSGTPQAKGAAAAFYSQTFPSMPAGWTVSSNAGSVNGWRWANAAPSGAGNNYPINGLINSTTKANGWLLYNADSVLSNAGSGRPFGGSITSSAITIGASHTNVMLSFQQYFRYSTGDSCFVDVSSNGTSWTSFPVFPNMLLSQFGFLYRNPTVTTLNISSVVGGQANAYIRFRFNSTAPTYSFNWLIDDLMLYDADPIDLGITYSGIASSSGPNADFSSSYSYSSIPLRFVDTVYPITYLSNYGLVTAGSTAIIARYYRGGNLLATHTMNATTNPLGARDSVWVFNTGYKPTAIGDYVVALSINPTGDGFAENNVDTIRFRITDTVYASYGTEFTERNCYLNRPAPFTPSYWGARFTISNGQYDTITSVSAAFRPTTVVGERVQAQLFEASGSGSSFSWIPMAVSYTRTLGASDISTSSNVVVTNFPMRLISQNYSPLILGDGDYAIVLTTVNSTSDVAVYSMVPPLPTAPAFIGYQGQAGDSPNDGSVGFAVAGGIATGVVQVPLVHPNFGNARSMLAVKETEPIVLGAAYPNPAETTLNIPMALQQRGTAEIILSNTVGQVLIRKDLGTLSTGKMQVATVSVAQLPDGLYFYTVRTEAGQATGRVVVRH
jgi:hypothetical protein